MCELQFLNPKLMKTVLAYPNFIINNKFTLLVMNYLSLCQLACKERIKLYVVCNEVTSPCAPGNVLVLVNLGEIEKDATLYCKVQKDSCLTSIVSDWHIVGAQ